MPKKLTFRKLQKLQRILIAILGALCIVVLLLSALSRNEIVQSRPAGEYTRIENVTMAQNAGQGDGQTEFRFTLGEVAHGETLAFFVNHYEVTVYVGDECVYNLSASSDDAFATDGGNWISVSLYERDSGKEVRVLLTPLYENYPVKVPEFLLGAETAARDVVLYRALPALLLSLCVIFTGSLLLCLAVYHGVNGMFNGRLCALAVMAISAGVWRVTYDNAAYLFFADHTVLVYTLSVVSLMGIALSMLNAVELNGKGNVVARLLSLCYCALYIVQLTLQATGVADLRQTLKAIHITIVLSAVMFILSGIGTRAKAKTERHGKRNFDWILSVGVVCDLLLYYSRADSLHMVCTLAAILCYSIIEGIYLLYFYVEQKNAIKEMEAQLILSRSTTMMSQIRSHFVFNILNAISGMCKYDPEMADETVVRFARYLRNNIDIMENDRNIPFSMDYRQLEDYVALEQVRFGEKIEFYADIETEDFEIPPLILQPVVENAIKHGVSKKQGNGTIILRTRDVNGKIVITVEDDGVGFDMAELEKEKSVGIRNIRFRLEHLVHGTLEIQSEVDKGTTVTITIPRED